MLRTIAPFLLPSLLTLASCGSTPTVQLSVTTDPVGASVYLSRVGARSYRADVGPVEGDVRSETYTEGFVLLGTSPLTYESPLEEEEHGAKILGIGGAVVLEYHEGVLRFERPGFETVERRVRFQEGAIGVHAAMQPASDAPTP